MEDYEPNKCRTYGIPCQFALGNLANVNCFASHRDCDRAQLYHRTRVKPQEKPAEVKEGELEGALAGSS